MIQMDDSIDPGHKVTKVEPMRERGGDKGDKQPQASIMERFVGAATTKNISSDQVEHMLRSIDFHYSLRGFVRRIRNLHQILSTRVDNRSPADEFPALGSWINIIDVVLEDPDRFIATMDRTKDESDDFLNDKGTDPVHGQMEDHGLESLLWITLPSSESASRNALFILLQAQMVMAQASILTQEYEEAKSKGAERPDLGVFQSVSRAAREAKRFTRKGWLHSIDLLPNLIDRKQYKENLEALVGKPRNLPHLELAGSDVPSFPHHLDNALVRIAHFLDRGLSPGTYEKREYSKGLDIELSRTPSEKTNGQDPSLAGSEIVSRLKGSEDQKRAFEDADESPADHLPRRDFILVSGSVEAATWIRAAQERANQMLPRTYAEPHPGEFLGLLKAIMVTLNSPEAIEMVAWTESLFWLSCTPEQVTNLMVGLPETPAPNCDFYLCLKEIDDDTVSMTTSVRIRALEPPYRKQLALIPQERPRKKYFELEDVGELSRWVGYFLELRRSDGKHDVQPDAMRQLAVKVFARDPVWYRTKLEGIIQSLGQEDRISVSGLSHVLFQRLIEQGDIVAASQITCRDHRLASARKWYATYSIKHLRRIHSAAGQCIRAEIQSFGWPSPHKAGTLPEDPEAVGSRRCVKDNDMAKFTGVLKGIVRRNLSLRNPHTRLEEFRKKHNAFTILAIWTVEICVGMRGITHPYFHASEYDQDTGYGTFTDKDPGEGKKSRPFRLPELAKSIMKAYDSYLAKLPKFGLPAQSRALPCYFVRLTTGRQLEAVPVSPSTISESIGGFFEFAPNWGRRLIKTTATEIGIPPAFIDIYCGHFQRGEESFNPYASLDPLEYFDSMDRFLAKRLVDLGLEAIELEPCL